LRNAAGDQAKNGDVRSLEEQRKRQTAGEEGTTSIKKRNMQESCCWEGDSEGGGGGGASQPRGMPLRNKEATRVGSWVVWGERSSSTGHDPT